VFLRRVAKVWWRRCSKRVPSPHIAVCNRNICEQSVADIAASCFRHLPTVLVYVHVVDMQLGTQLGQTHVSPAVLTPP
jgi:hypothetical protein